MARTIPDPTEQLSHRHCRAQRTRYSQDVEPPHRRPCRRPSDNPNRASVSQPRSAARSARPPRPCMLWTMCCTPSISIVAQSLRMTSAWARSRKPRYWAWDAAGLSGMTSPIDGRADVPFRHLSQGIDPCLGYSVGLGRQRPVPHAIPTKSVAAGLQSERLLGLLENPRRLQGSTKLAGEGRLWNAAGLVGNGPRHRRPCRRPKGRDVLRGGGPVGRDGAVTLLLADFVTFNQIHGMSGLSGIAPAVLRSLECAPSGREWSSP